MSAITLKTLAENTTVSVFAYAEWGLSIYLEADGKKILFDTGAGNGNLICHNANVLGVRFEEIDHIVLSHGHQDHTGGLRSVLEYVHYRKPGKKTDILCHPEAVFPKFVKTPPSNVYWHYGMPFTVEELTRFGGSFRFSKDPEWLGENIVASGEIPMTNDYETVGEVFAIPEKGKLVKDTEMIDDQALYIKTDKGLVVILGCAHRGIINTLHHAQKVTNTEKIYMVVGGTHLANVSDYRMTSTINELKRLKIEKIGVSHCTGLKEAAILYSEFGTEKFFFNNVGTLVTI